MVGEFTDRPLKDCRVFCVDKVELVRVHRDPHPVVFDECPQSGKRLPENALPVGGADRMRGEGDEIRGDAEEVYAVVGCAMEVMNEIGHGFHEKPYENSLTVEFGLRNIPFTQQPSFDLSYKGHKVGEYIPDLIAFDAVIVDTKVIDHITDHERGQMLNYLRITRLRVGIILNFAKPKLEWERIVL